MDQELLLDQMVVITLLKLVQVLFIQESVSVNGDNTAGIVRLTGNTLELEDSNDGDFNDFK